MYKADIFLGGQAYFLTLAKRGLIALEPPVRSISCALQV